jgi:ATP-binding cassette subfamily G (WHITE) protein 2 (PDR)
MIALMIFGCFVYLVATEYISEARSKGEVLLFRRTRAPHTPSKFDEEELGDDRLTSDILAREKSVPAAPAHLHQQTAIFHWNSVCYDIKVKKEEQRILNEVDGWVRPGTLTALMVGYNAPAKDRDQWLNKFSRV